MAMRKLAKAIRFATQAHEGQFDKAGYPYVLHPLRVAEACESEDAKVAAVLHDVVEDTDVSLDEIFVQFDSFISTAVDNLTKRSDNTETYRQYLDRVASSPISKEVKLNDMADNTLLWRIEHLSIEKRIRLLAKYTRGRHYLLTGEWYESDALDVVIKEGYQK